MNQLVLSAVALLALALGISAQSYSLTSINGCQCGVAKVGSRIIGGRDAGRDRYPWQVGLLRWDEARNGGSFSCGGSLINDRWILTAAHCFSGLTPNPSESEVAIGAYTQSEMGSFLNDVDYVWVHPRYNNKTVTDDIALMRLKTPVKDFGTNRIPICLPEFGAPTPTTQLKQTGWGLTQNLQDGGRTAQTMQEIEFAPITDQECRSKWSQVNSAQQLCAGYSGRATCQGDSGGPLSTLVNGKMTQVGVVSYGAPDCGKTSGRPAVFTRVSAYLPQIYGLTASGSYWCT